MNYIDYFDHGARYHPDRLCLTDGETSLTYRETQALSHRVALALQAQGISEGSKVAVYSPNHRLGFAAMLGLYRAGAVFVPINAKGAVDENAYLLNTMEVECLFYHSSLEAQVTDMREQAKGLRLLICLDQICGDDPAFEEWCHDFTGEVPPLSEDPNRLAFIPCTGGTTGRPKGAGLTNRCLEALVACTLVSMPTDEPPVHLLAAPITHAAGTIAFPLFAQGATQLLMGAVDPEAIMQMIEKHQVTHLFLPPTVIYVMLTHPKVRDYDYSSLKYFIYAAAPMSADKLRQAIDIFGPVMVQTYGQAEAPMLCTFMSAKDHVDALESGNEHRLTSCGKVTPFTRLAIMDDEGNLLPNNEKGEIVIRSSLVMEGYYNNPEATEETQAYGWHHTGDIATMDDEGFVYIVDRKKDMIISGGFNVYPSEIEQVIWSHPCVQDCAVIGVPDEKWGEAVKAVIEAVPGKTINEDDIINQCKERLGSVKAPKTVEVWESLPRSPVGKVLKKTIRQSFWEGMERSI